MKLIQKYWLKYQKQSNPKWLGKILNEYNLILFGVAMRYVKNPEIAKDVVQEVFLIALEKLPHIEVRNIGGWLYTVTKNEALQVLAKNKQSQEWGTEQNTSQLSAEEDSFDKAIIKNAKDNLLWEAINTLNEDQKDCIIQFYIKDKTYQEIVDQGKYEMKEVKSHIQNGKRNLKIKLAHHTIFQKS